MFTTVQAVYLWIGSTLSGLVVELVLYFAVDWCAQKRLMECPHPFHKQLVWLCECVVLLILANFMWYFHFPFILLLSTVATLAYTQTAIGEYSRMLWNWLQGHWDVCQEHSGIQNDYATVHDSLPAPAFQAQPAVGNQLDMVSPELRQRRSTAYTQTSNTDLGLMPTASFPAPVSNVGGSVSHGNMAWNYPSHPVAAAALSVPPISSNSNPARQPMENVRNSAVPPPMAQPVGAWQQTKNIVQQAVQSVHAVLSSTTIAGHHTGRSTPCGLRNGSGENLCFLNAVLQSLARTPTFVDELVLVRSTRNFSSPVVDRVADLFYSMKNITSVNQCLDTTPFRHAASAQLGSYRLVVAPYSIQHQVQQDASEFLTWLLEHLHGSLNETIPQTAANQLQANGHGHIASSGVSLRQFAKLSLIKLKAEFNGPVKSSTINILREGAMRQIEQADGSDGRAYIGPMRAVSCLDRLQHSMTNSSLIEDLFCGQIVDARQCDDCRHVTVNTQTFRILIVPVPDSDNSTGVTALGKCLEAFGQIEQMWGQNGLDCDVCNQVRLGTVVRSQSDPTIYSAGSPMSWQHNNHRAPILSPICRPYNRSQNASDYLMPPLPDNRTSTPIPGAPRIPSTRMLTNCKRRSLLGHLPPVLVIQLMRYGYGVNNLPVKLKNQVSVPLSGLSLTDLLLENVELRIAGRPVREVTYELYAMCLHFGSDSTSSGHYVSYARCGGVGDQRTWFKFDDSYVHSVNIDYELNTKAVRENVYLLFYHRTL